MMMSKYRSTVIVCAIFAVAVQGCANFHTVRYGPEQESIAEINQQSKGRTVQLTLNTGDEHFGRDLEFRADSTSFFSNALKQRMTYANPEISSIALIDRGSGAWKGLTVGCVTGFVTMALAYYAVDSAFGDDDTEWSDVVLFGVGGSVFGGVVWGLPIGWLVGERDIYRFENAAAPRR